MQCNVFSRCDYGGFWRRGFANFLDGIFLGTLSAGVGALLEGTSGLIAQILLFLTFIIGFKGSRGATPGYQLLDMKVVAITGDEVTVKQIVVRLISSLFSVLAFGLGFIWIAIDANRQAWHDKIAGTYVVRSGAKPIRTLEISQTSLVRVRLFSSLLLVTAILLVGLFARFFQFMTKTATRGRTAIDEFHRLYHAGDYLAIYTAAHPTLQQGLTRDDALLRLSQVRAKFGNVVDISWTCQTFHNSTLRIEYHVTFDSGKAWETYDWRFDGEKTRLLAYAIEAFETGKPDWEIALAPRGVRPNGSSCAAPGNEQQVHWWEEKR